MVNLVVALPAEAKPLVAHFLLKPTHAKPLRIFQNEFIRLIISGIGKEKSAQAISFLHELSGAQDEAWINIGIAGHRDHAIGTGILAHKITDSESKKSWYPAIVFKPPTSILPHLWGEEGRGGKSYFQTDSVLTVSRAESRYENPSVYDMEASGFYEAALPYSTVELIHCYKVISDNAQSSHWKVTPGFVEQMIGNRLNEIAILVTELQKWVKKLHSLEINAEELEPFLIRWHFTVTQQFQLRSLVRRLKTLAPGETVFNELSAFQTSHQVLVALNEKIDKIPLIFDRHCEATSKAWPKQSLSSEIASAGLSRWSSSQ